MSHLPQLRLLWSETVLPVIGAVYTVFRGFLKAIAEVHTLTW